MKETLPTTGASDPPPAGGCFTALGVGLDAGANSALSVAQQAALKPLLTRRDAFITVLARNDPASAERLAEVHLACRQALRGTPPPPAN